MKSTMSVLVLGGSGFVGYTFVTNLLKDGFTVMTLNRGTKKGIHGAAVQELYADRTKESEVMEALSAVSVDAIVDVSGYTKADVSSVVKGLKKPIPYVFISTAAVYQNDQPLPYSEQSVTGPNSKFRSYGTNKIEAENLLLSTMGPLCRIIRPPYIYGPWNTLYREAFFFDRIKNDLPILVPTDGSTLLQFIYIDDLYAVVKLALDGAITASVLNAASVHPITMNQYCITIASIMKKKADIRYCTKPSISEREYFPFFNQSLYLNVHKLLQTYSPATDIEQGLLASKNWYDRNPGFYSKKPDYAAGITAILAQP
ncbi:MAG: NAD-dependent epimerase/dehydratase family protein [Chitinivibrionales bacterium]|nr:NAD-dependent epimerase/dehydratase family protein [Chitinivibrionales bacterium]